MTHYYAPKQWNIIQNKNSPPFTTNSNRETERDIKQQREIEVEDDKEATIERRIQQQKQCVQ